MLLKDVMKVLVERRRDIIYGSEGMYAQIPVGRARKAGWTYLVMLDMMSLQPVYWKIRLEDGDKDKQIDKPPDWLDWRYDVWYAQDTGHPLIKDWYEEQTRI